jgi:hypothetical protein
MISLVKYTTFNEKIPIIDKNARFREQSATNPGGKLLSLIVIFIVFITLRQLIYTNTIDHLLNTFGIVRRLD